MPSKKAKEAIAYEDSGFINGWRYSVSATYGIAQITGPTKRVAYKLTRDCPMERAAQRAEIREYILRQAPEWGRGDGPPEEDDDVDAAGGDEHFCSGAAMAALEPATQVEDVDMDDGSNSRASNPVGVGNLESEFEAAACALCDDDELPHAFDFVGGGYCCEDCVSDSAHVQQVDEERRAVMRAREAASTQPRPDPPRLPPRRSERVRKTPSLLYDLERSGKGQPGWSEYDLGRLDARHDRTRDESYPELQAARDKLREEVDAARGENVQLAARLDSIFGRLRELAKPGDELQSDDCQTAAAVILREAIAELAEELEPHGEVEAPAEDATDRAASTGATAAPPEPWLVDGPVRMGGVNGAVGQLSIGEAYLSWLPSGCSEEPAQHIPLSDVLFAAIDDCDEVRRSARTSGGLLLLTTHAVAAGCRVTRRAPGAPAKWRHTHVIFRAQGSWHRPALAV